MVPSWRGRRQRSTGRYAIVFKHVTRVKVWTVSSISIVLACWLGLDLLDMNMILQNAKIGLNFTLNFEATALKLEEIHGNSIDRLKEGNQTILINKSIFNHVW